MTMPRGRHVTCPGRGPTPTPSGRAKVADRIIEDVMAMGWPVGEVLGSEADLLERYEVSRAVFREAVRLLEHQQVARTRRGPGGGLVITEPTIGAVIDAVVLYLHRVDARLDEIFEAAHHPGGVRRPARVRTHGRARARRAPALRPQRPGRARSRPARAARAGCGRQPQCRARAVRRRLQPGGTALLARLAAPRQHVSRRRPCTRTP